MEFPHLVHALSARAGRRPLVLFALLGTLLFVGRHLIWPSQPERATLKVVVDIGAAPAEVARATDDAILLSLAIHSGFARSDAAVRDRLVRNVRFVNDELTADAALEEALRLDMHRSDPVAKRRLIFLASQTLAAATRSTATDKALRAHMQAHAERFQRPPTISFEQVFVSRQRHGEGFEARVKLVAAHVERALSDPSLLPTQMMGTSPTRIDARFGPGFARRLEALDSANWSAPLPSAFGVHFVRIVSRSPAILPKLEQVRARVRHDHERDTESKRVRAALSRMRAAYRILVEERT